MPHGDEPQPNRNLQRRAEYVCGLRTDGHGGGPGTVLRPQDLRRGLHSVGLRAEARRRVAGRCGDLLRRQLFPHVPAGVSGVGDDDRADGRDGRVPEADRQRGGHSAGAGRDAAGHLPVAQSVQPLSGLRNLRHAGHHHRHHPANHAYRNRHDRRHVARARTVPQAPARGAGENVHAADRPGTGHGLCADLCRDLRLRARAALPDVPLPDERPDGSRRALHGGLSRGVHRHEHCRLDTLPLPGKLAPAAALDFDSGIDAERNLLSARGHSGVDVRPGETLPEQPRRQRLHPHSDDGRFARRGVRRDQVARDTHGGLRRSGLHRHPSGDPPRGAGAVRERRVGCRPEFLPSDSFGGRGETRGRLFVSHDSLHGECHGLVQAVPSSDAHFTAPAKRQLAQIDHPAVEQQQNPMSVDHGRQFSGTYSPSWASIFSKVDLNSSHIASPLSGLPISTIRLLRSSKND